MKKKANWFSVAGAQPVRFKARECQDVPNFLKKFDVVQRRMANGKGLQFSGKKTQPALWTQTPEEKRRRELDVIARGLRKVRPTVARRRKASRAEQDAYRKEAREYVQDAIAMGVKCPVVLVVPELRDGMKYGRPISARLNEVHHTRGRAGSLLRDQRFWLAVSKQGHRWIHEHPKEARLNGWMCEMGDWNAQIAASGLS